MTPVQKKSQSYTSILLVFVLDKVSILKTLTPIVTNNQMSYLWISHIIEDKNFF